MDDRSWKKAGNSAYRQGQLDAAKDCYDKALVSNPFDYFVLANKAAVETKLFISTRKIDKNIASIHLSEAIKCATQCVDLVPSWPKGYLRKARF